MNKNFRNVLVIILAVFMAGLVGLFTADGFLGAVGGNTDIAEEPETDSQNTEQGQAVEIKEVKLPLQRTNGAEEELVFDVSKGNIRITEDKIIQGENEVTHNNKAITLNGSGNRVETVGYTGKIILNGVTLNNSLIISEGSDVTLELKKNTVSKISGKDGKKEEAATAGILVNQGGEFGIYDDEKYDNKVTITGSGTLEAYGNGGAGIGGQNNQKVKGSEASYKSVYSNAGTIHILGGNVFAKSENGAAAIGGGNHGDGGNILIGGDAVVTAEGSAAGIGSGLGSSDISDAKDKGPGYIHGGNITIEGNCEVNATGGWLAAGIGGGYCADSGYIVINGGNTNAYGNNLQKKTGEYNYQGGAGIGGGYQGHGNVVINRGIVNAEACSDNNNLNAAAGIGSGATANSAGARQTGTNKRCPDPLLKDTTVIINGGTITARGGNAGGAGIGAGIAAGDTGKYDENSKYICIVEINGGDIKAYGGASSRSDLLGGAGIGSGNNGFKLKEKYSSDTKLKIDINGGTIKATGGWGAAGIGSGADNNGPEKITIADKAAVTAFADGTKLAVDTYTFTREEGEAKADKAEAIDTNAPGVFQMTFIGSPDEEKTSEFEGLKTEIYKAGAAPKASEDGTIYYEDQVLKELQLPEGYRSAAVNLKDSTYLVKSTAGDKETWFQHNTRNAEELKGLENEEKAVYMSKNTGISDRFWLFPYTGSAEAVPVPEPEKPGAEKLYNLTIHYVYDNGETAAADFKGTFKKGQRYGPVNSPEITGYTPEYSYIVSDENGMPAEDVEITIVYTAVTTPAGNPDNGGGDNAVPAPGGGNNPAAPAAAAAPAPGGAAIQANAAGGIQLVPITDDEVPLAKGESGNHRCCIFHFLVMLLAVIVLAFYTRSMKKRQERINELKTELETEQLKRQ
ncbi:MAG: hypothetical protein Q4C46_00335 [Bacillota bacterium]|nr:hypothetical protein [Bacillota bacterium]